MDDAGVRIVLLGATPCLAHRILCLCPEARGGILTLGDILEDHTCHVSLELVGGVHRDLANLAPNVPCGLSCTELGSVFLNDFK